MPRPPATQSQTNAVRSKIRRAAVDLYLEQGLNNLTARAIAVRAEVSVGTIYKHFGNLSELARTLWQGPVETFEQSLEDKAAQHQDPLQRLKVLLAAYLEFARQNPDIYRGAFLFVRPPNQDQPEPAQLTASVFARLLIHALHEGQQQGSVSIGDAQVQAQLLWAGLHGVIALPINLDRLEWNNKAMQQQMVDGLLRMISS